MRGSRRRPRCSARVPTNAPVYSSRFGDLLVALGRQAHQPVRLGSLAHVGVDCLGDLEVRRPRRLGRDRRPQTQESQARGVAARVRRPGGCPTPRRSSSRRGVWPPPRRWPFSRRGVCPPRRLRRRPQAGPESPQGRRQYQGRYDTPSAKACCINASAQTRDCRAMHAKSSQAPTIRRAGSRTLSRLLSDAC